MRRFLALVFFIAGLPTLAQNNILNNGGFESGLTCYAEWIWSNTGESYVGDYRFSLSNDAHSGSYSLKIGCSGSDCAKAAAFSEVPAPANQNYNLSVYAKCPAGDSALIYVPGMSNGDVGQWMTCDGNWDLNQISFQTGNSAGNLTFAFYNYGTSWVLLDDVVLTYGDGTAPQHTILYPGVRNVSVTGQTVNVDGTPFLSLGFYDAGYYDLAQVAATGATTIIGFPHHNQTDCFNNGQPGYLDLAYQLGLNFVPDSTTTAEQNTPSLLSGLTQRFGPHLANIAWYLADEPDQSSVPWFYIPPSTFLAESSAAKTNTSLPMVADFQRAAWSVASDTAPYNGSVDIWMAEPYGSDFSGVNNAVNVFNAVQPRPIWLAQDDIGPGLIVPKAYWAVIAGATGIHYFNWDAFKADPPSLAAVQQAFGELKGLNSAIFGQKIDNLVLAPPGIASMSRYDPVAGTAYILSANNSTQTVQGKFAVQGLAAGQPVTVLYENRTTAAAAGSFTDSFAGVSRHVYQIHTTSTSLTATIANKTGANAARTWQIEVYNTGLGPANSAQVMNVALTQTGGTVCSPTVAPGTYPVLVGNLGPSQNGPGNVIFNFTGCDNTSKFTVKSSVSANSGASNATVVMNNVRL